MYYAILAHSNIYLSSSFLRFSNAFGEILLLDSSDQDIYRLKVVATELLALFIDNNVASVREMIVSSSSEKNSLLCMICSAIAIESDSGLLGSLFELVKSLLNIPNPGAISEDSVGTFLNLFYPKHAQSLIAPVHKGFEEEQLSDDLETERISNCIELFIVFIRQHTYRVKYILLQTTLVHDVVRLVDSSHKKHLQSLAIRFIRTCLGMRDDFYNRFIVKNDLIFPFARLYEANGFKDNMIHSALNDLFEFILQASREDDQRMIFIDSY